MDLDALVKNWKEWAELLLPLIVFLGLYLFRHVKMYTQSRRLKEIAPLINGELILWPFMAPRIQGNYMGIPYRIAFTAPGRGSPGGMQIRIDCPGLFSATMTPKDRGGKGLEELFGRGKVLDTGEDVFGGAVRVRVEAEREKAMLYLDNQRNRENILALFAAGFGSIRFFERGILLVKPGDFLGRDAAMADQIAGDLGMAYALMR